MKTEKFWIVLICMNFIFAFHAYSEESSDRIAFEKVAFDHFDLYVKHDRDFPESSLKGQTPEGVDDLFECWVSHKMTIYVIGQQLWLDGEYYLIPKDTKVIWRITSGELYASGKTLIKPTRKENLILDRKIFSLETITKEFLEVSFTVANEFHSVSGDKIDDQNGYLMLGATVFHIKAGELYFQGKNYGKLIKGSEVTVDKNKKLTIIAPTGEK